MDVLALVMIGVAVVLLAKPYWPMIWRALAMVLIYPDYWLQKKQYDRKCFQEVPCSRCEAPIKQGDHLCKDCRLEISFRADDD